jgi:hypothetical protein
MYKNFTIILFSGLKKLNANVILLDVLDILIIRQVMLAYCWFDLQATFWTVCIPASNKIQSLIYSYLLGVKLQTDSE